VNQAGRCSSRWTGIHGDMQWIGMPVSDFRCKNAKVFRDQNKICAILIWKRKDLSFIALADHQFHFLEFSFSVFSPASFYSSFILILQIKIVESDDLFKTSGIVFAKTAISNMIVLCE
jgi:hypothetical protein